MEQLKQWYAGLEDNEQKIVLIASALLTLLILVFGIIKPMNDKVSSLEMKIKTKQSTISEWQTNMPKLLASKGSAQSGGNQSLSNIVTTSTRRFNLRVSRVQEKASGEMQVWFDNVPFNDFVRWVAELNNRYQVSVATANIRNKDRNGLTSIDVKIRKS